jgi:hypothetical protein
MMSEARMSAMVPDMCCVVTRKEERGAWTRAVVPCKGGEEEKEKGSGTEKADRLCTPISIGRGLNG